MNTFLDLFAGAGGWDVAVREMGMKSWAVETSDDAVRTQGLNGGIVPYRDVWDSHLAGSLHFDGVIASPPCPTFSSTGNGSGNREMSLLLDFVRHGNPGDIDAIRAVNTSDERTKLALVPLHYAVHYRPHLIVLEQVPSVLPLWSAYLDHLAGIGYSGWASVLNAADYGVPQDRRRAVMVARLDSAPDRPKERSRTSMAEALRMPKSGWHLESVNNSHEIDPNTGKRMRGRRYPNQVSFTITSKAHKIRYDNGDSRTMTVREAATLQTFPEDFEFFGGVSAQRLQIGNAVPPKFARVILEAALS